VDKIHFCHYDNHIFLADTNPGSKNYFFGQRNLNFFWAANFISKSSRFYKEWQQFLLK
jgi:hypothetical protein